MNRKRAVVKVISPKRVEKPIAPLISGVIESLGEEEKQLVALKLDDMTNDQIAEKLGCSERTVRRLLKQVQARLKKVFEVEGT